MEIITAEISAHDYISGYRDVEKFIGFCRECPNYGRSWLCPPFDYDLDARLSPWSRVHIAGISVEVDGQRPVADAMMVLHPARVELSAYLLDYERSHGGLAFGFSGKCLYCDSCSRLACSACVHPDKARPSLEAYGFDVGATAEKLLGIKLEWACDGLLPRRLSLVGAVFLP